MAEKHVYHLDYVAHLSRSKPPVYEAWLRRDGTDVAQSTAPTYRQAQLDIYYKTFAVVCAHGDEDYLMFEEREPQIVWDDAQ